MITPAPLAPVLAAGSALLVLAPDRSAPARVVRLARHRTTQPAVARLGGRRAIERLGARWAPLVVRTGSLVRQLARRPPDPAADGRVGLAVAAGLATLLVTPWLAAPLGLSVWAAPALRERSRRRRASDALVDELPNLVDLFRLAVSAGLTVHLAVLAVAARARGVSGAALAAVPDRVACGERLSDALERFGGCGDAVRPLAAALVESDRYGAELGPALDRLAFEARLQRRRAAEEAARRLPVRLLFPLVLCILPAFVLLTVVPLALAAVPELLR